MKQDSNIHSRLAQDRPKSIGARYLEEYITAPIADPHKMDWVENAINTGQLIICPRCHVLHLPHRPFPPESSQGMIPANPDPCDVCGYLYAIMDFPYGESARKYLEGADGALIEARAVRANLYYDLWMGAYHAAEDFVWATMEAAISPLRKVEVEKVPVDTKGENNA